MLLENSRILADGSITEYHICKEKKYDDLNCKLFCLNDIEDTIKVITEKKALDDTRAFSLM